MPPASPAFLTLPSGKVLGQALPATRANAVRLYAQAPAKPRVINTPPIVHTVTATSAAGDTGAADGRGAVHGGRNTQHDQRHDHSPKHR